MEWWKKKSRDKFSAFEHLVEQVDEQSELCDFSVKVGQWEKKFHRCVLAACPYFEKIITGNFVEKKKGMVEIKHDTTSNCVDMALMFLYGRKPDITSDNVEGLLELAEYFMIEGLKSSCIKWFRFLNVTENNCMWLMKLSSKYNFEMKSCIKYIESHLHEVFQNEEAFNLSKDSVEYLFSDRRFSYVTNDEKLTFLAKWVSKNSDTESEHVTTLFKTIDIQEVSKAALENAKSNAQFDKIINLDQTVSMTENENTRHNVLIVFGNDGLSWCLDLHEDRWYRLNSQVLENEYSRRNEIAGIVGLLPEIYFKDCEMCERDQWQINICSMNLENDTTRTYKFHLTPEENTDGDILIDEPKNICFGNDIIISTVDTMVPFIQNSTYKKRTTYPLKTALATDLPNHVLFSLMDELDVEMTTAASHIHEPRYEEPLPLRSIYINPYGDILPAYFHSSFPPTTDRIFPQSQIYRGMEHRLVELGTYMQTETLQSNSENITHQRYEFPTLSSRIIQQQEVSPSTSTHTDNSTHRSDVFPTTSSRINQQQEELPSTSRQTEQQTETLQPVSENMTHQSDVFPRSSIMINQKQQELPSTSRHTGQHTETSQLSSIGILPQTSCRNEKTSVKFTRHSQVNVGYVSEEIAEMLPLFTLRNEHIAQACLNKHSTIGLLTKSLKHVILFDLRNFKMDKIELETINDGEYTMVPTELGFKIYNSKRCYSITRSIADENQLTELVFEHEEDWNANYHYFNGMWIRVSQHEYDDDVKLHCIYDDTLSSSKSTTGINWTPLSLPDRRQKSYSLFAFKELCVIPLSKSKLRCDIECPHCKLSTPRHVPELWNYLHSPLPDSSDYESVSESSNNGDSD